MAGFDVYSVLANNPYYVGPPGTSKARPDFAKQVQSYVSTYDPQMAGAIQMGDPSVVMNRTAPAPPQANAPASGRAPTAGEIRRQQAEADWKDVPGSHLQKNSAGASRTNPAFLPGGKYHALLPGFMNPGASWTAPDGSLVKGPPTPEHFAMIDGSGGGEEAPPPPGGTPQPNLGVQHVLRMKQAMEAGDTSALAVLLYELGIAGGPDDMYEGPAELAKLMQMGPDELGSMMTHAIAGLMPFQDLMRRIREVMGLPPKTFTGGNNPFPEEPSPPPEPEVPGPDPEPEPEPEVPPGGSALVPPVQAIVNPDGSITELEFKNGQWVPKKSPPPTQPGRQFQPPETEQPPSGSVEDALRRAQQQIGPPPPAGQEFVPQTPVGNALQQAERQLRPKPPAPAPPSPPAASLKGAIRQTSAPAPSAPRGTPAAAPAQEQPPTQSGYHKYKSLLGAGGAKTSGGTNPFATKRRY
jgi:hypothetical protein